MLTLLAQAVAFAQPLVLVPLFLAAWGQEHYGQWLTLTAVAAYGAVLDLGFQAYVVNRLTECWASHNDRQYQQVLQSALSWTGVLALLVLAAVSVGILLGGADFLAFEGATASHAHRVVLFLVAVQVLGAIPLGIVTSLYRTLGEYPRGVLVGTAQRLVHAGLTGILLFAGRGVVAIAAAQLVPFLVSILYVWWDLPRRHSQARLEWRFGSLSLAWSMLAPGSLFFVLQLAMATSLQGSTLLVSGLCGTAAVALFVTLRTLVNGIRQVCNALSHTLWPDLTELAARKEWVALRQVHHLSVKVQTAFALSTAVFLGWFGEEVVHWWTAGHLEFPILWRWAFLPWMVMQTPWMASSMVLIATNRPASLAWLQLAACVAGLGGGTLLVRSLGPAGMALGLCLGELLFCVPFVPWLSCRLLGTGLGSFWGAMRGALPVGLSLVALAALLDQSLVGGGPALRIVLGSVAVMGGGAVISFFFWLNSLERQRVLEMLRWRQPSEVAEWA